jgi:hypothetical protein
MGIDLIWFGVIIAMNLQTSFLTPPFGFALFYLRSVAPKKDYNDRITGALIPAVTTPQIYKGSIAFIVLQLTMVAVIIFNPQLVIGGLDKGTKIDADSVLEMLQSGGGREAAGEPGADPAADAASQPEDDDPMKGLLDAVKQDQQKN